METELKAVEEKIDQLRKEQSALHEKRRELKLKIIERDFKITIGTVVKHPQKGEFRITWIDHDCWRRPWVKGVKRLKSGEWGEQAHNLYGDWVL